ncbi:MAG: HD domain-containing protein [Candidatus Eremiobacteraeota bacterium]|nr:HD domain-containing protein [Candidatus Eremiobacteraeota bacterium]MBC5801885.1 HD domain-containing protein [Candidatus Eremiobacteraeota bacterium]MBC5822237.1 HD domain-containing protein [Candidatus Eremiobacteraeota bacterium]
MAYPLDRHRWNATTPENVDSFEVQLRELLDALERHDEGTRYHSESVSAWSGKIARTLGLSTTNIAFIERCAILHDIGKLFTPESILRKPGPLTADEWSQMRAHAANGATLLESIPCVAEYANVVRAHHERQDGTGYPNGLAGTAIPFEAAVISVADAFDAMISNRSYRRPFTPAHAVAELERCRGTQFEASVVDALVAVVALPSRPHLRLLASG